MSLTLEIPAEIEAQLREAAAREGRDVQSFLVEAALSRSKRFYSMDEAARTLGLARTHLESLAARDEISTGHQNGELVFLHDAKFDALLQNQREIEAELREIGAQNQALDLYDE